MALSLPHTRTSHAHGFLLQLDWLKNMSCCFWCQQESSEEFCTRCNATAHTACLASYLVSKRGCAICESDVTPARRVDATSYALEKATLEYGEAHANAIMRKLDVAIALSHCGRHREKRQLLEPLLRLKTPAQNEWLILVGRLEHARASLALAEFAQTKRSLRPLWKLRKTDDKFLALLFAEALCLFAKVSLHQGNGPSAWKALQQALRVSDKNSDVKGSAFCAASALRTVADAQQAAGSFIAAAGTLRRVTGMLEQLSPRDTYAVACARIDESAVHIVTGKWTEAKLLLRKALPELRKRKGGYTRTSEAALLLGSMVSPRKRLRAPTHPECVEE